MPNGEDSLVGFRLSKVAGVQTPLLIFMGVWLTVWSLGVAVIQFITLSSLSQSEGFGPIALFVLTHGGSEVGVIYAVTRELKKTANKPRNLVVQKSLDEQVFSWQKGSSTYLNAILSILIAAIVYILLFAPLVMILFGTGVFGTGVPEAMTEVVTDIAGAESMQQVGPDFFGVATLLTCLGFAAVWVFTWTWWFKAYRAQMSGLTTVTMRVTSHQLAIREERPGIDQALQFANQKATMALEADSLTLTQEDTVWHASFPKDTKHEFEAVLRVLQNAKGDVSDTMEIPKELADLRNSTS